MRLFAAGLGNLFELIILLVAAGIWAINQILGKRGEEPPAPQRPRRIPPRTQAGLNPMEPQDVDQFLDEVLGRAGGAKQAIEPQAGPSPVEVVVLRPSTPSPRPRPQPEPRRTARPSQARVPRPRAGIKPAVAPQPPAAAKPTLSQAMRQAIEAVGQAASATQEAAALQSSSAQAATRRAPLGGGELIAMLRSPADIRRAILLREILSPPVALRRRR